MIQDTQQLIDSLAQGAQPVKPMASPLRLMLRAGAVLLAYAVVVGSVLGLRADLAGQLHRPFYLAEILLLVAMAVSGLAGAVHLVFPDQYQHAAPARLPFYALAAFILLLAVQAFLPPDSRMVLPDMKQVHGMDCTLCIAMVAFIPAAMLFVFLRRGASVHPLLAGAYVVLAAAAVGCLMLRLAEANDSLLHLAAWHYLPTALFAGLGAMAGKIFLKW